MLTRIYLRHYAYIARIYPSRSPLGIHHLTVLGVGWLVSLCIFAAMALGLLVASVVLARPIAPWSAPKWLLLAVIAAVMLLPGWHLDKRMLGSRRVDADVLSFYNSRSQRIRWWLGLLSILPLCGVIAACFAAIRHAMIAPLF